MARLFDDAASNKLQLGSAVAAAAPLTLAAWARSDTVAQDQVICGVYNSGSAGNHLTLEMTGTAAGDPVQAIAWTSTGGVAATTTGFSANVWHHCAAVFASSSNRAAFIDGGSKGTSTTSRTPTGINRTSVGARDTSSPTSFFSGDIAEVGIWNRALSDAEVAALAKGFSPLWMPNGLVFYAPLIRNLTNYRGATPSATGTTVSAHPPKIIHPRRLLAAAWAAGAPPTGAAARLMLLGCGA